MSTSTATTAPHATALDTRTHHLYRFFGRRGDLLYVGITVDRATRFADHRKKPWWVEVADQTTETFPTRADALYAESVAITSEAPRYNRDIPSLNRVDVLRSRATMPFAEITPEDRIRALESQLRFASAKHREAEHRIQQAANENRQLTGQLGDLPAQNAELKSELEEARKNLNLFMASNAHLRAELEAKQQPRIFVVEAPRAVAHRQAGAPPVTPAALPRKSFFHRILGGS